MGECRRIPDDHVGQQTDSLRNHQEAIQSGNKQNPDRVLIEKV